jgi:hypothetical protein
MGKLTGHLAWFKWSEGSAQRAEFKSCAHSKQLLKLQVGASE